nr:hypothetical protein [Tanacetum cinerariifolium]
MLRMKHTNRRVRIPKGLYSHRIEGKLTKKQVGGEWIIEREMMISKDGTISKFPGYHSSEEEEPTEQYRALNKYGFIDHPELQRNEFVSHRLPQREGMVEMVGTTAVPTKDSWHAIPRNMMENEVKYASSSFVNKALTWWNTQVQARGREAAIVSYGTLTKGNEKIKGVEESSKQGGGRNDDKRMKVRKGFMASTTYRNEYVGSLPKCAKCFAHHPKDRACLVCFNCQKPGHIARNYCSPIKQVAPINAVRGGYKPGTCYECGSHEHYQNTYPKLNLAHGQVGNRLTIEGNQKSRNNRNQVKGRAFNLNAVEVADGKKVKVDRVISKCKLELGTSLFTIDLIPLGHGSFYMIVGMDWLFEHKAEIVCHEKVVRIPLESGEILIVQGERTPGIAKALSNVKTILASLRALDDMETLQPASLPELSLCETPLVVAAVISSPPETPQ